MSSRVDSYIWANQTIVSNANLCQVEHRAIVVSMEIIAHMDVLAEVACPRDFGPKLNFAISKVA
jgi:hypothetical protein